MKATPLSSSVYVVYFSALRSKGTLPGPQTRGIGGLLLVGQKCTRRVQRSPSVSWENWSNLVKQHFLKPMGISDKVAVIYIAGGATLIHGWQNILITLCILEHTHTHNVCVCKRNTICTAAPRDTFEVQGCSHDHTHSVSNKSTLSLSLSLSLHLFLYIHLALSFSPHSFLWREIHFSNWLMIKDIHHPCLRMGAGGKQKGHEKAFYFS